MENELNNHFYELKFLYRKEEQYIYCYTKDLQLVNKIERERGRYIHLYKLLHVDNTKLSEEQFYNLEKFDKNTAWNLQKFKRINYLLAIGDLNILHSTHIIEILIKPNLSYTLDIYESGMDKCAYIFPLEKIGRLCELYLYSRNGTWQRHNIKSKSIEFQNETRRFKKTFGNDKNFL